MRNDELLLRVEHVSKTFGATRAVIDVDLEVRSGTVHGLIGENGSGKSTLSSLICGAKVPDSGKMIVEGREISPRSMNEAQQYGIAMITQEKGTIAGLSVAENIFVGKEFLFAKSGIVSKKRMNEAAQKELQKLGVNGIKGDTPIDSLNFEMQKIVEIVRALYGDPKVLIFDETTTSLSEYGRGIVYRVMETMRDDNKAVLFITHDLDELMEKCTNVTIMRDGEIVTSLEREEMEVNRLRELMVGRKIEGDYYRSDFAPSWEEEVILSLHNVSAEAGLDNFSMEVHKGEILGIGGLTDCGMHELGRLIFGIERPITGEIVFNGVRIDGSIQTAISNGMGYVSKNRDIDAIILNASIRDNVVLPSLKELQRGFTITKKRETLFAEKQIEALSIKCESANQYVSRLSGGNKQKVVLAKWLGKDIRLLVMDCPTRGVDVGVKAAVYALMTELKKAGTAIVMISEELNEIIGMSDRVLILKNGKHSGEFVRGRDVTEHSLINYMI